MIKIVTIIGARPQIIKAAALSRAIKNKFSTDIIGLFEHAEKELAKMKRSRNEKKYEATMKLLRAEARKIYAMLMSDEPLLDFDDYKEEFEHTFSL